MYSFVLWGISSRFGLFCHHCYSLHKTESRLNTWFETDFYSEAVCVLKIHSIGDIFQPKLKHYVPSTLKHVWFLKIIARYTENEHFLPSIPRSLLWTRACDGVLTYDR